MGGKSAGVKQLKGIGKAQQKLAETETGAAQDVINTAKQNYAANKGVADKVLATQLPAMQENLKASREDRARYLKYFAPVETSFAQQAAGYDTPGRREAEAGRAVADVSTAAEAQRNQAAQTLESYGIDPSMTRAQALDRQVGIATAGQQAQAANLARQRVEQTGIDLRQKAIGIGTNVNQQALGSSQAATTGGNAAINTQLGPGYQETQGFGAAAPLYGSASQALSGGANTYGAINQQANQTPLLDVASTVGGMAAGAAVAKYGAGGGPPEDPRPVPAGAPVELDTVPTVLGPHEYVIPSDVARRKGTEFFDKLVHSTRKRAGIPTGVDQMASATRRAGVPERMDPATLSSNTGRGTLPALPAPTGMARPPTPNESPFGVDVNGDPLPSPGSYLSPHRLLPLPAPTGVKPPPGIRQQPPQGRELMQQILGRVIGQPNWVGRGGIARPPGF